MRIISFIFLGVSTLFVASCVSAEHETDYAICNALATKPKYNVNYEDRVKEMRRRGINCRNYDAQIDKEVLAERIANASAPRNYTTKITKNIARDYSVDSSVPPPNQVNNYRDLVCTNGRVMTNYGCRYR